MGHAGNEGIVVDPAYPARFGVAISVQNLHEGEITLDAVVLFAERRDKSYQHTQGTHVRLNFVHLFVVGFAVIGASYYDEHAGASVGEPTLEIRNGGAETLEVGCCTEEEVGSIGGSFAVGRNIEDKRTGTII